MTKRIEAEVLYTKRLNDEDLVIISRKELEYIAGTPINEFTGQEVPIVKIEEIEDDVDIDFEELFNDDSIAEEGDINLDRKLH